MSWELYLTKINEETGKNFTESEAKIHVKSFRKSSKYYWMKKGHTEKEALKLVIEFQTGVAKQAVSANKGRTDIRSTQLGYWLKKGYDEETAKLKLHNRQHTFSKSLCIEKYGEVEGLLIWKKRQDKWQSSLKSNNDMDDIDKLKGLSITNFINKFGAVDGKEKYIKLAKSRDQDIYLVKQTFKIIGTEYGRFSIVYRGLLHEKSKRTGTASKESLRHLIPLYKRLRKLGIERNDIMVGVSGSKEYCVEHGSEKRYFDFTIISKKIIVEYNNKAWHPNPTVMSNDEWLNWKHPFKPEQTAKDKYIYDCKKNKLAEDLGFKILILWNDSDNNKTIEDIEGLCR